MSILIETKRYAACPECGGKVGSIDHLAGDETAADLVFRKEIA